IGDDRRNDHQIATYWTLIEEAVKPTQNQLLAVVELKMLFQHEKTLDEFYERARELVEDAGFEGPAYDRMLRDTILSGLSDHSVRDKITRKAKNDMTIEEVMKIARAEVSTRLAMQAMNIDVKPAVNYLSYEKRHKKGKKAQKGHQHSGRAMQQNRNSQDSQSKGDTCYRCGKGRHQAGQKCGATDVICHNCGKKGHYARICQAKGTSGNGNPSQSKGHGGARPKYKAHHVQEIAPEEPLVFDEFGAPVYSQNMVRIPPASKKVSDTDSIKSRSHLMIEFPIDIKPDGFNKKVIMQCDTGCDVNCINERTYRMLFPGIPLQPQPSILQNYGSEIEYLGTFTGFLRWKGKVWKQSFYVTTANDYPNLLCRKSCFAMGILK
ncbi:MAG: hypothetical protein MJA29_05060, partial [Candidatus Omnitrophica bacterium]|nr:hypothetical protein [Candidatus Omnitrophota bacterium]